MNSDKLVLDFKFPPITLTLTTPMKLLILFTCFCFIFAKNDIIMKRYTSEEKCQGDSYIGMKWITDKCAILPIIGYGKFVCNATTSLSFACNEDCSICEQGEVWRNGCDPEGDPFQTVECTRTPIVQETGFYFKIYQDEECKVSLLPQTNFVNKMLCADGDVLFTSHKNEKSSKLYWSKESGIAIIEVYKGIKCQGEAKEVNRIKEGECKKLRDGFYKVSKRDF